MRTMLRIAFAVVTVGVCILVSGANMQSDRVVAQERKPVNMYRFYTGSDGLTHVEKTEVKFPSNEIFKMIAITGAELHRSKPGRSRDWHQGPQRQYIVNLSGNVELEVAGGEKVDMGPGDIEVIEDTTGKGHITRTLGTEDRVSLWLPFVDQSGK